MERRVEVDAALGKENLKLFLQEVRGGKISKIMLKQIALKFGGSALETFKRYDNNSNNTDIDSVQLAMMLPDCWYKVWKPGCDQLISFKNILEDEDINLGYLSQKMKADDGSNTTTTDRLNKSQVEQSNDVNKVRKELEELRIKRTAVLFCKYLWIQSSIL